VCDAAFDQIPAPWRTDVLVTIDGAGASHDIIEHLTALNTAPAHGRRGRRVEYSIGWPVDERTMTAIGELRDSDWGNALHTDGAPDPDARVDELTGIPRGGPGGDRLAGWPPDLRVMARRVPRPAGKPAKLGEDAHFEYGAFATNTPGGQLQWLDARHRTQAHVEDRMKQIKARGARNLPSLDYDRNAAWPRLAALATSLTTWLRHLALDGDLAKASTKTLRFRLLSAPARLVTHARRKTLKVPPAGPGPKTSPPPGTDSKPCTPPDTPPPPVPTTSPAPPRPSHGNRRPPEHHRDPHHTQDQPSTSITTRNPTIMKLWISMNDLGQTDTKYATPDYARSPVLHPASTKLLRQPSEKVSHLPRFTPLHGALRPHVATTVLVGLPAQRRQPVCLPQKVPLSPRSQPLDQSPTPVKDVNFTPDAVSSGTQYVSLL
ncbi:MAG: transposase, partial [Pseudonocardiaceae bacterium]